MGAGSSARKVQAEVKLREEAERRADAEAEARKRVEAELAAARHELLQLRAAVPQAGERMRVVSGWVGAAVPQAGKRVRVVSGWLGGRVVKEIKDQLVSTLNPKP